MFRCVFKGGSKISESTSDYAVKPQRSKDFTAISWARGGEIPAARLADWRASISGMIGVRLGRCFIEPTQGRLAPCRNLNYQQISGKVPKSKRTKYRATNMFVDHLQGEPAPKRAPK
ncbi:hypothetical protein EGW08_000104 [Elysia chlorotica]|uniref:Uncharacterized protein n=1 Tax=Elysia chlorotica TaxID=188477 RepID=A0A3S1A2D3_ELYCH|nr:hypothetical protein EGW08_000104 [Elysia chlorotica]